MSSKKYWICTDEAVPKETKVVLNDYLLSLKLENRAEATIDKYRRMLAQFLRECTIPLEELTSEEIREWLDEYSQGKKPTSIDLVLSVLTSFFTIV